MALLMASASRTFRSSLCRQPIYLQSSRWLATQTGYDSSQTDKQQKSASYAPPKIQANRRYRYYFFSIVGGALIGTLYTLRQSQKYEGLMPEYMTNPEFLERQAMEARPVPPPVTKRVTFNQPPKREFPFKITLYQYVTCPFCCKVRAYLNYNRIPYDIVEVNSVMRSETKWSIYKKVPIVVIENEQLQLNDSSMIISAIESYFRIPTKSLNNIAKLYQPVIEKDEKGKYVFNYANKYFLVEPLDNDRLDPNRKVSTERSTTDANNDGKNPKINEQQSNQSFFGKLFGQSKSTAKTGKTDFNNTINTGVDESSGQKKSSDPYKLERKWREWVDNKLVHTLSPNVYCTFKQSLNTFLWFSQAGDWEQIFPWYHRWIIVYVGAVVMRVVAGRLRKKYNLKDDVRLSLYECGNEWMKAVGKKDFLGGSEPNLADLNVYGALTSIQGCEAFQDLMDNTQIQPWFNRMKQYIEQQSINAPITG